MSEESTNCRLLLLLPRVGDNIGDNSLLYINMKLKNLNLTVLQFAIQKYEIMYKNINVLLNYI